MKRFTIRMLMALVVVTAVGLAALRNADGLWAGCLLLVTLTLLLTSVLGAVYTTGHSRAGWLGFSLFGFAYLVLAFSPLLPDRLTGNFPTLQLLNYVHTRVSPPQVGMGGIDVEHDGRGRHRWARAL